MNKFYHRLRIFLSAVLPLVSSYAMADYTIGDLTYAPDSNSPNAYADVTGRATSATEITIPETVLIDGKKLTVRGINDGAFANSDIVSIAIPPSITIVRKQPFKGCTSLSRVDITDMAAWSKIDFSADGNPLVQAHNLYYNGKLVESVLVHSVRKYENENGITYTTSKPYTFQGATCIKNVSFEGGITEFDGRTLSGCTGITSIQFPSSLKYISNKGCSGMVNLESINIPESTNFITSSAFKDCKSLKRVVLPKHCRFASGYTFQGCTSLEEVVLSETTTNVYPTWPETVFTSSTYYIFEGCTSLKKVTMPKEPIILDRYAFMNSGITELPDMTNVSTINDYVFQGCKNLASVEWPSKFTTIPQSTFSGCSSLASIVIPSEVTEIKPYAFSGTNISEIEIPSGVTQISSGLFRTCKNLQSLTLHKDITTIASEAFYGSGLQDLILLATTPPSVVTRTFQGSEPTIYVLPEAAGTYANTDIWNTLEIRPLAIDLGSDALHLGLDETYALTAEYVPASFKGGDIIWTSENPGIATVDADGVVTPISAGTTHIKAVSSANNTIAAAKEVEVSTTVSVDSIAEATASTADVYDMQGRLILSNTRLQNISGTLQPGIYLIRTESGISKTIIR